MANITQEIALLERQKKSAKTNRDKVDIMRKVKDLKEKLTKQQTQTTLPAARKVVKQMPNESFKELIARLKLKPEYAFLKNMGLGKIADDYRVVGKRVGWRVKGHHNYKVPSKKFRKDNPDLVYYEDRKNRSDVYRPDRLEQGGNTDVKGLREGQSYTWMKGGVEHTIYIDKIEGNSILFRLDGKYQKYSRKNFNEFIEQIGATPDYMAKGGAFKPYGKTKGRYAIEYFGDEIDGQKQTEIWLSKEMAIDSARRYSKMSDIRNVKIFDENGAEIKYAKGGEVGDNNSTIFDSLKKGDKINITYSSGISRTNEKKLQLRSKNIVGKGKSYESEKITFDNLDNPTGVKYYAYKRKDDSISFAMGDMAISQVVMTKEGVMATGGSVKKKSYLHIYKLTYPDGKYRVETYDGYAMTPKEALEKMRISLRGLKSYKYAGASSDSDNYKKWHTKKDIGYSDTEAWDEVFGKEKYANGGQVDNYKHFDLNSEGNFASKKNGKNYEIIYRDDKSQLYDLFENGKKIKSSKSVRDVMTFEDGGEVKTGVEIMAAPKGHPEVEGNFLFPSNANKNTLGIKLAKGGGIFNEKYLDAISNDKKTKILKNIANHYGISVADAEDEIKDADAEMLYEYISNDQSLKMSVYNDIEGGKFAKGGNLKYYDKETEYRLGRPSGSIEKEILEKVKYYTSSDELFMGNFGWITPNKKSAEGYLYKSDGFDTILKDVKLKAGERIFIYLNSTTAIGGMTPLIKINLDKELLYFLADSDNDEIVFETKGVPARYIALIEHKMAKGGEVAAIEVGDWVSEKKGTARGKVYEDTGSFIKLEDKYGGKSNTLYTKSKFKKSVKPRY